MVYNPLIVNSSDASQNTNDLVYRPNKGQGEYVPKKRTGGDILSKIPRPDSVGVKYCQSIC